MAPRIAIVYYSMYGHIAQLAEAEAQGIRAAGGSCDIYQVPETLPSEVLTMMHAPGQNEDKHKIMHSPDTLEQYDAFLLGIPTRYGNFPAQWKAFIDQTGKQWMSGAFWGKYAGIFVSTSTQGGGQETTVLNAMSTLTHHGIIYVPMGYKTTMQLMGSNEEVRGGTPWGAGTLAGADGSRQPSKTELALAEAQGNAFYQTVAKVNFSA